MNFKEELARRTKEIEKIIEVYMPKAKGFQRTVIEAMNYSIQAGGKRLRPMLMRETFCLFQGKGNVIEPFMAAIEMIHTYSLVHDDLPAMDNDEYRRGRKTTHIVYGEGMAILAGDGLLNYAFETACKAFNMEEDIKRTVSALKILSKHGGIYGMIGGQSADVESQGGMESFTREKLIFIHCFKTGALIQAAMEIGAVLAGADQEEVREIGETAQDIGMAFQIQDDILDVISTEEVLGKPIGSDEKNRKQTYVTMEGIHKARKDVADLSQRAIKRLQSFPTRNLFLEQLTEYLINREK